MNNKRNNGKIFLTIQLPGELSYERFGTHETILPGFVYRFAAMDNKILSKISHFSKIESYQVRKRNVTLLTECR